MPAAPHTNPLGHGCAVALPGGHSWPMPQCPVSAVRPVALQNAPPGHASATLRLVCGQIEPRGHATGAVTEAGQKNPRGHTTDVLEFVQYEPAGQPSPGLMVPAGHFWSTEQAPVTADSAAFSQYDPVVHETGDELPGGQKKPGWHSLVVGDAVPLRQK